MVATRAYLPVGFKLGDFAHLGEGSYCFCTKCRARLYPRRTQAEKLASRQALIAAKLEEDVASQDALTTEVSQSEDIIPDIHVEELEPESPDVGDIEAEGVKLADEETSCELSSQE